MAATKKPSKAPPASAKPKTGKKPAAAPPVNKAASKTAKPAQKPAAKAAAKPAAAKKPAPKPAPKQTARPTAKKPTAAASKTAPRKPLPESVIPIPGTAPDVPAQIIAFLEKFDALKAGKTWAVKAAALIEKIPAALFGEFEDALDLETPLSTGKIPLHLIDPKTAKTAAAKTGKGTIPAPRPSPKTFGTAILGNKIGREELVELVERLRWCLCCCHCWPCRPWPFCRICRWRLVKVSSTADSGWVYHLNFKNASAAIADRVAEITCPSGGSSGGPWAPQVWNASTPAAEAPVGYAEAGHDHDGVYSATGHNHDAAYAPKQKGGADIRYAEIDAPVGQTVKLRDKATSPSPADVTVSLSGHNHDTAYAAKQKSGTDIKYIELRSVDAAAKTATLRDVVTSPAPSDVTVSLSDHHHDTAYAAASHDNTSHTKKYFSRTNLIMKANPDTTLDAGHYWVKIQLSLPVGFTPGTSNWAECASGVCMDPTMAVAPLDLQAVSPTIITELEGGVNVPKLKFRLTDSGGTDYRKNNGIWAGKLVVVTVAAPAAD